MAFAGDRRNRKRVALRWPVRLFREVEKKFVESTTENLSSEGLYCITKKAFKLGENLICEIALPSASLDSPDSPIRLQCHITVKRVDIVRDGFGLGCHIEDYALMTGSQQPDIF